MSTKGFTDEEKSMLWEKAGEILTAAREHPEQACVAWNNYLKGVNGGDLSIHDINEGRLKVLKALYEGVVLAPKIKVDPGILLTKYGQQEPNPRESVEEMIKFVNSEIDSEALKAELLKSYGLKLPLPFSEKEVRVIVDGGLDELYEKRNKK